ncbi:MAG: SMC family ATPase [Candidatus Aenigmatarchaeota archaeon]
MIKRIRLVNWKMHKDNVLEFSDGTNVIVGINGAGKSSIMDAISFALFGTLPKVQSRKQNLEDMITNKPIKLNEARVELEFSYEGKDYSVYRVIERDKGTTYSELRKRENVEYKLIEGPNTRRVTEAIEKILKVDYELFSRAIYSEQNNIDYFIRLSPSERAKKIDNLLRIDDFERARSATVNLRTKMEAEKSSLQRILSEEDIEGKKREIDDLSAKISADEIEINNILKNIEELKLIVEEKQVKLKEVEEKKFELERLMERLKGLKKILSEKLERKEKLMKMLENEDIAKMNEKNKTYFEELKIYEKEFVEEKSMYEKIFSEKIKNENNCKILKNRNADIERELKNIEKHINVFNSLLSIYGENVRDIIKEKRKKLEDLNSEISFLEYKKQDVDNIFSQLEKTENKCPVCGSLISKENKHQLLIHKKEEIQKISSELEVKKNEKKNLELEIEKIESDAKKMEEAKVYLDKKEELLKEYEENESKIKNFENILLELDSNLTTSKDNLQRLEKQIDQAKAKMLQVQSLIEKAKELEDLKADIEKIMSEINFEENKKIEYESLLNKLNYDDLKREYENSRDMLIKKKTLYEEKVKSLNDRKNLLEKLKFEFEKVISQKNYMLKLEKAIKNLNAFEEALQKTQSELRIEFIESVNNKMSEIWQELYPYGDYVDIRMAVEDGNYMLQLLNKKREWVDVENLSGGESRMACLALRIAFSIVLVPHLNWLILDEPTESLDEKSVLQMADALRDRIKEFVSQVFIITHNPHLEAAATGEIYRIHRNKDEDEYSQITRVTAI